MFNKYTTNDSNWIFFIIHNYITIQVLSKLFYNLLLHLYGINRNIKNNLITPTYNLAMNIHNKFQNDKNIIIVCGTNNYTVSINEILDFNNRTSILF